ncbi:hypothetical protein NDU88_005606 [Pleurodeles waltl]|uniref:Uncharacterized protein n=1 Tax=Pleurodeles waltl TaxID=8319 RepID=A0AAV7L5B8_PLEWA|nr:hypothetical protein NDU88_005606 [Pleurodeles waltl]
MYWTAKHLADLVIDYLSMEVAIHQRRVQSGASRAARASSFQRTCVRSACLLGNVPPETLTPLPLRVSLATGTLRRLTALPLASPRRRRR